MRGGGTLTSDNRLYKVGVQSNHYRARYLRTWSLERAAPDHEEEHEERTRGEDSLRYREWEEAGRKVAFVIGDFLEPPSPPPPPSPPAPVSNVFQRRKKGAAARSVFRAPVLLVSFGPPIIIATTACLYPPCEYRPPREKPFLSFVRCEDYEGAPLF